MEDLQPHHPYSPVSAPLSHYAENELPLPVVVGSLGLMLSAVAGLSIIWAAKRNPGLALAEKCTVAWFAICGFLHCFFEGYFVLNHSSLAGQQTLFAQLWKEYSLSDSRYLTSDPFMVSVETITVLVWGPLSLYAALCIVRNSTLRHPVQMMVCMGHLYGVVLYYTTSTAEKYFNDVAHSRPEFLYFWVYYFGFNLPWVVVPSILLSRSIRAMRLAFMTLGRIQGHVSDLQDKIDDIRQKSSDGGNGGSDSDVSGGSSGAGSEGEDEDEE